MCSCLSRILSANLHTSLYDILDRNSAWASKQPTYPVCMCVCAAQSYCENAQDDELLNVRFDEMLAEQWTLVYLCYICVTQIHMLPIQTLTIWHNLGKCAFIFSANMTLLGLYEHLSFPISYRLTSSPICNCLSLIVFYIAIYTYKLHQSWYNTSPKRLSRTP